MMNGWQTDLPNEAGDWHWVDIFSCNCCIHMTGIALVTSPTDYSQSDYPDGFYYIDRNGVSRVMFYECNIPPIFEGKPAVTAWKKFENPFTSTSEYLG